MEHEGHRNSKGWGGGGGVAEYEAKVEYFRGVQNKKPIGGVWIFSGTAQ